MKRLFFFNHQNPTARYKLDCSNPCDYAVAERLHALNDWEKSQSELDGRPDCSALGNRQNWRNLQANNMAVDHDDLWVLPLFGSDVVLTFDYVCPFRVSEKAPKIHNHLWKKVINSLEQTELSSYLKVEEKFP